MRKSIRLALVIASCVAHLGLAGTLSAQVNVTTSSSGNGMLITEGATLTGSTTPTPQVSLYGDTTSHRIAVWNNAPTSAAYIVATWPCTLGGCMVYADPTSLGETKLDIVGAGRILTSSATAPSWSATPTLGTSTVTGTLTFQATSSQKTTLTTAAPSANRTYTFPDFGGNENITAVNGTPTSNHMTKWGSNDLLVDDSLFSDNGTTLTYTGSGGISSAGGFVFSGADGVATTLSTATTNANLYLDPNGTGSVQLGGANISSPTAQVLASQGSRGGTDTNIAGGDLTIEPGDGTGTSTPSRAIISAPAQGTASGSGAQTYVQRIIINGTKTGLATGTAASLFTVNLTDKTMASGKLFYGLEATDGTDVCAQLGESSWSIVDKGGTFSAGATLPVGTIKSQSGSNCTTAFSATVAWSSNTFQITPTLSSMTPTVFRITFTLLNYGQSSITLN